MKICLLGKMRSGKDTVSDYLTQKYGLTRFAFADQVKANISRMFPDSDSSKKNRHLLQGFAQKMRELDEEIWIRLLFDDIKASGVESIIITDCRLQNEYDRLKQEGYVFIKVDCDDFVRIERMQRAGDMFSNENFSHITERLIDGYPVDFTIDNSGNLDYTHRQLDNIISKLKG